MATNKWAQDQPFPTGMVEAWKTLAEDHDYPEGLDSYDHIFNNGLIFPLQRRRELEQMIRVARRVNPTTVMEIGADKGGGLYHWCMCLPSVRNVIACEIRGTPYRAQFERMFPSLRFLWLEGDSLDPENVEKIRRFVGPHRTNNLIDCLFIDGDKSKMDEDFHTYLPMVNPHNGRIFIHDVQDNSPKDCFHRILRRYKKFPHNILIDKSEVEEVRNREPVNSYESWLKHWNGRSCTVGVVYIQPLVT